MSRARAGKGDIVRAELILVAVENILVGPGVSLVKVENSAVAWSDAQDVVWSDVIRLCGTAVEERQQPSPVVQQLSLSRLPPMPGTA